MEDETKNTILEIVDAYLETNRDVLDSENLRRYQYARHELANHIQITQERS